MSLSLIGAVLVSLNDHNAQTAGYVTWIVANMIWVYVGYVTKQIPIMIMFTVYLIISIFGFIERLSVKI